MFGRYPRPQMVRAIWQDLSGRWIINGKAGTVPSCRSENNLVYEKSFIFKKEKARAILHIDGADQVAKVFLNGKYVGTHEGGYLPFEFEITNFVNEGDNSLRIEVEDYLDTNYPYGKQCEKPHGMWYTPVSGIWKDVWIEQVPAIYIKDVKITTNLTSAKLDLTIDKKGFIIERSATIKPENPIPWTPENPYLYYETINIGEDSVKVYYALRTIGQKRDAKGVVRVVLNGKPLLIKGVLDQGYWEESLFIPNSPYGYEGDILRVKELGFNALRKHIKIESEEFYYQCDRLGMLVVQDMVQTGEYKFLRDTVLPSFGYKRKDEVEELDEAQAFFLAHSKETVAALYNHPCIIAWTIFNEGWGQFSADKLYEEFKEMDKTRLVDATSGWFKQHRSDFDSVHIYFRNKNLKPEEKPMLLSECGGYTLALDGKKAGWGYGKCKDKEELTDRIIAMCEKMVRPALSKGLCGFIYTQLSDVEGEINGLYSFDRRECKVNEKKLREYLKTLDSLALFKAVSDKKGK